MYLAVTDIDDFFVPTFFLPESNKSLYMVTNEYLISSIFNIIFFILYELCFSLSSK